MNDIKIPTALAIFIIVAFSILSVMAIKYFENGINVANNFKTSIKKKDKNLEKLINCGSETKTCPDGTTVSQIGPNCEFPLCPGENNSTAID